MAHWVRRTYTSCCKLTDGPLSAILGLVEVVAEWTNMRA